MKRHAAPVLAAILLLLPLLYVVSYLALVQPPTAVTVTGGGNIAIHVVADYRFGVEPARGLFWPLEQIDRTVRPGAWITELEIPKLESEAKTRSFSGILPEANN